MPDLIVYKPAHGYANDTAIFVSWLGGVYYVCNRDANSFKLAKSVGGAVVQYTDSVISGYVRADSSAGTTTISGLDHLEGQLVYVVSGGVNYGSYTVSSGSITLNETILGSYQVGLPYAMKARTMRFAIQTPDGTQARIKRIHETVVRYLRTKGGQAGQQYNDTEYLTNLNAEFGTSSKDAKVLTKGGFSPDGFTVVKSAEPFPMTVLATIVSVEITEE